MVTTMPKYCKNNAYVWTAIPKYWIDKALVGM